MHITHRLLTQAFSTAVAHCMFFTADMLNWAAAWHVIAASARMTNSSLAPSILGMRRMWAERLCVWYKRAVQKSLYWLYKFRR
jgi:hypothetical protein